MTTGKQDTVTAWFAALCFFLSAIEYMIPKPLPFLRLGLANLPIMLAIGILPFRSFCALILIKILGQGLVGGTLFSYIFVFSAAGTVSSAFIMFGIKRAFPRAVSFIGISVAGAFTSNIAQLALARWYIFGESAWFIAPPFLAVGAITGGLLGLFANRYSKKSKWYRDVLEGRLTALVSASSRATAAGLDLAGNGASAWRNPALRLSLGLLLTLALMFSPDLRFQAALSIILVITDRSRIRIIPTLVMSASIISFNLLMPFGRVIATPAGFPLTEGALVLGIKKALALEGMLFISRWMLKPGIRLPGRSGSLVSQAFGILGHLTAERKKLDPNKLIESMDDIMYGRAQEDTTSSRG